MKDKQKLKAYLDSKVDAINHIDFVKDDPISIPKSYSLSQDIEITAFWVAMLAWGQRKTIINKSTELFTLMDNAPHDFIVNHEEKDRAKFKDFKHRTFQYTDTLYFLEFLQSYYRKYSSLETAFDFTESAELALIGFHERFFSLEHSPHRTRKHVSTPSRNSSCKKLNMFLRWMVRTDSACVDFGLWKNIPTSQLMIPLDVHVQRVATKLGILKRTQTDWKAVVELTKNLRQLDPEDPIKYDFALFGIGVLGEL